MHRKLGFRFIVISDRKLAGEKRLIGIVEKCCISGIRSIMLREKDLAPDNLLKLAVRIRSITKRFSSKLIVNDRLDIAMLIKADAIHIPSNGSELKYFKKIDPGLITGKSVHSLKDAVRAELEGYDYLLFGPVFRTPAKIKYGKPQGLINLRKVCSAVKIPIFAVGGITPERSKKCIDAGAHGVAVIGAIMKSKNVRKTAEEFKKVLGEL
jgi:thiamine-phosphate pyrophosphorylase